MELQPKTAYVISKVEKEQPPHKWLVWLSRKPLNRSKFNGWFSALYANKKSLPSGNISQFSEGRDFVLFEIDHRDAGFAFTEGSKSVGFDITGFFELVMDGGAEFSGTAAMDNGYLIQVGEVSVIQIFVQLRHSLIDGFSDDVEAGADRRGFSCLLYTSPSPRDTR